MPLARVEIEQIESHRWVAEVEIGGFMAKRRRVTATDWDSIMAAVVETHDALMAERAPKKTAHAPKPAPAPEAEADEVAHQAAAAAAPAPDIRPAPEFVPPPPPIGRKAAAQMRARRDEEAMAKMSSETRDAILTRKGHR